MASELKRGTLRIVSNYTRLASFIAIGIFFVPIFIYGVGMDAFGILGLLGSAVGIAGMVQAIVRQSLNRELAAAYHSGDPEEFADTYNSAIVVCMALAVLAAAIFGLLFLILPLLKIPDHLLTATKWLLLAKAILSVLTVLSAPQINMYLVTERMPLHNLWGVLHRATDLVAAVVLFLVPAWLAWIGSFFNPAAPAALANLGPATPAQGLTAFAFASGGSSLLVLFTSRILIMRLEPRLKPQLSRVNRASIRKIISTAGWNTAVVTATNMHIRLDQFVMNIAFGTFGNGIFTLGQRLTGYILQIAAAATDGLDVVSSRVSSKMTRTKMDTVALTRYSTRIQAMVTLPAALVVILYAQPLMDVWVARALNEDMDHPNTIPMAVAIAQLLVIGMTARGIAECWMRILYGAGHIRRYAPMVLIGGLMNPLVAVGLLWLLPGGIGDLATDEYQGISYLAPAMAYASIFIVLYFLCIPSVAARCLGVRTIDIFSPLFKPIVSVAVSSVFMVAPLLALSAWNWPIMLVALMCFVTSHTLMSWFFVLDPNDRDRLRGAATRQFQRMRRPDAHMPAESP
jgi:O-antigen/teichoic acid export membrane protein